jgi:hypothetical protein
MMAAKPGYPLNSSLAFGGSGVPLLSLPQSLFTIGYNKQEVFYQECSFPQAIVYLLVLVDKLYHIH